MKLMKDLQRTAYSVQRCRTNYPPEESTNNDWSAVEPQILGLCRVLNNTVVVVSIHHPPTARARLSSHWWGRRVPGDKEKEGLFW